MNTECCWTNANILPEKSESNFSDILKLRLFNGNILHGFYSFADGGYIISHLLITDKDIVKEWKYA